MVQNWQTWYFWNKESQETLSFQFQLIPTTLKFWPSLLHSKILFRFVRAEIWSYLKNSFTECFYYVNQGWEPNKTTIVDIGIQILPFLVTSFLIYVFLKKKLYKLVINKFRNLNIRGLRKKSYIFFNKKRIN